MKRYTRRYVRQQSNWFRLEDPLIHWFQAGEQTADEVIQRVKDWSAGRGE
jgi:tRNA A37 N6-isopentenylltransferase MiaA